MPRRTADRGGMRRDAAGALAGNGRARLAGPRDQAARGMVDRICRADARAFVPPKRLRVERRDTARRLDDGRSSLPSKNCRNQTYGTLDFKGALAKYSVIFVSAVLEQWFRSPQVATGRHRPPRNQLPFGADRSMCDQLSPNALFLMIRPHRNQRQSENRSVNFPSPAPSVAGNVRLRDRTSPVPARRDLNEPPSRCPRSRPIAPTAYRRRWHLPDTAKPPHGRRARLAHRLADNRNLF